MSSTENMVRVYRAANATEAHVIRGLLEQHDIRVRLIGEHLSSGFGELPAEVTEVELHVPAVFEQLARQLISEYEQRATSGRESGPDWICAHCGESNPADFGVCWNCNAPANQE